MPSSGLDWPRSPALGADRWSGPSCGRNLLVPLVHQTRPLLLFPIGGGNEGRFLRWRRGGRGHGLRGGHWRKLAWICAGDAERRGGAAGPRRLGRGGRLGGADRSSLVLVSGQLQLDDLERFAFLLHRLLQSQDLLRLDRLSPFALQPVLRGQLFEVLLVPRFIILSVFDRGVELDGQFLCLLL